jgi:formylglycine-generating enzyme required for sulfatase activity
LAHGAPSELDIFLSYAREDEARAGQLAEALEQHGFAVFWDREVPPGETWHSHIGHALVAAKCVVVAWSRHSIVSDWVIEEASEGKRRKILVPVLFEAVQPPFGFGGIQAASLIDWRPGRPSPAFSGLVGAARRIVSGQAGSGTGSAAPDQPRSGPARPPQRQFSDWRMVLATLMGFVVIAGAGGAAVFWWRTQPEPTPSSPGTEAGSLTPEPGSPDPAAGTEAPVGPATQAPSENGESREEMRDCPECPELVLVPAGEFMMGSGPPDGPGGSYSNAVPQHKVTIAEPFWVGKHEVTFAEWDVCVAAGGCSNKPDDAGWGRDTRPVINASWNDATEYVGWLSQKTRNTYRLLSEAEWEYVARAGTTTVYWWGDEAGRGNANCSGCGSEWDDTKTAPVGSFKANDFGLYDTAGNVWEWLQDCYHQSYDGAPTDGSAWEGHRCSRVMRGGSWRYDPAGLRSDFRYGQLRAVALPP